MERDRPPEISEIRQRVLAAFREGQLSSYERPTPTGSALQILALAKAEMERWLETNGETADALRLFSLILESLTQYASAINILERLSASGYARRDDLKRLARCRISLRESVSKAEESR